MADGGGLYLVRRVSFLGSERRVLLQSENGPCPLLAICNVLLLRRQLTLPSGDSIGFHDLLQLLSNLLLDANTGTREDAEHTANIQESLIGCMEVLPTLNVGLDVNCRFSGPRDFEPTRELSVFDLFDISVVHGWVVSPSEELTFATVGSYSYNALADRLVKFDELPAAGSPDSTGSDSDLLQDGPVIREFLEQTANQLTYEGIIRLHGELRDNELAVLYRNHHFNTLLKHDSSLYLLCTDVGFLGSSVVWERLDAVDGDTSFLGADFGAPRAAPPPPPPGGPAATIARATCPSCGTENQLQVSGPRTQLECFACSAVFEVAVPWTAHGAGASAAAPATSRAVTPSATGLVEGAGADEPRIPCKSCGAILELPPLIAGQHRSSSVKCQSCGKVNKLSKQACCIQ